MRLKFCFINWAASFFLILTVLFPQKSNATVISAGAALLGEVGAPWVAGLVCTAVGTGVFMGSGLAISHIEDQYSLLDKLAGLGLMIGLTIMGPGLVLDGNAYTLPQFQKMSIQQANTLGLSEPERISYNDELGQLNAISEDIVSQLRQISNPTVEQSDSMWRNEFFVLSLNSQIAVSKIILAASK